MGCGDEKLSKYLTQTFTAHCNAMICQQVTLSGDAEWPKVADTVIEAHASSRRCQEAGGSESPARLQDQAQYLVFVYESVCCRMVGRALLFPHDGGAGRDMKVYLATALVQSDGGRSGMGIAGQ